MLKLRETVLLEHFTYMVWLNLLYDEVDFFGRGLPQREHQAEEGMKADLRTLLK